LKNIKISLSPTLLLLNPKIISNKSLLELVVSSQDGTPDFYRFKAIKTSNWNANNALEIIHNNLVVKDLEEKGKASKNSYKKIFSVIDLDNDQIKQSLGALLIFMQTSIFHLDEGKIIVSSIKTFPMESFMRIDTATFKALQIFSEEVHPNVVKGVGRSKEGFSLFGLFDRTLSAPGRLKLKEWMAKPFCDIEKIRHRQRGVALVVRSTNREFIKGIAGMFRHVHDVPRLILRIKKVEATQVEWYKIHSSLQASLRIVDQFALFVDADSGKDQADIDFLKGLCQHLDVQIVQGAVHCLEEAIDFEIAETVLKGTGQGAVTIREGYDAFLDQQRTLYDNIEKYLVEAAHKILDIVPLLEV
jgi:DNA mismatch repair protein MSH5